MLDRLIRAFLVIGGVSAACAWTWPGVFPEGDPVAVLVSYHTPNFYAGVVVWYYLAPGVAVFIAGQFLISSSRIWFARMGVSLGLRSSLPAWPLSPAADGPAIVVGEVHHPVRAIESPAPEWLTIPERGLYTGVAIFGAVGSGKTSACMHPFARQLLSWQADNPERRPAALILEVKGDFCHDIRRMLVELDRGGDYIELSLDGRLTWNPLSATWLDSYSLAYTVASLLNQLFGKGKEPFWQQAYTNLVRWIIELYRVLPPQDGSATPGWVTLRDVYHCAIDKELFAKKIKEAQTYAADMGDEWITIDAAAMDGDDEQIHALSVLEFLPQPERPGRFQARGNKAVLKHLKAHKIKYASERAESSSAMEIRLRVEAVNRWYVHDWNTLDNKIRSSIVEGVSVFLSMFDLPSVARVFCPPAPGAASTGYDPGDPINEDDVITATNRTGDLPPLDRLIESGKVLALNMPAGTNPALSRAVGVMLKNAWLQSLLRRPATMKAEPGRYFRPAVFICDEYQAFASVGEDDPSGDEKAFALTRQCRVIPIVATQSISSLRSVLGSGEAWRTLLQTLRTRIFLSLSDEASAEMASKLCGQVAKIKSSYTINESAKSSGINLMSAQAGGGRGSVGASKSFQERREALFQPRDFALLGNCQAICLPYDGVQSSRPAPRLLEAALPPGRPPVLDRETDRPAMSKGDGLDLLKPFLPGLEAALEDPDVSEIMINGPGNVWLEGHGRLSQIDAPDLDAAALERAAIHIARPLGLDPATMPVLDARLGDGSRVAICVPPASPHVAITVRRFGKRSFSAAQLVDQGALPEHIRDAAARTLHTRRNILVSGGTGSGKTTLLNALIELIPDDERIVAIEDTLELRIDSPNCVRFEARGLQKGAVTIRDLVRHALRHRPDHIVVGEVRGGEAADLLQALNTGHGGSLTTVHANNAESALSRLASCAMQGGGDLPWDVTCRGVVDGISMVIHMTRADGRRFVEEAAYVKGYDAGRNAWEIERLDRKPL